MNPFMADNAEKAQHLRRCSPHHIRYPRVACTIVWQPWAIKNVTPTALKRAFLDVISFVFQHDLMTCHAEINIICDVNPNNL